MGGQRGRVAECEARHVVGNRNKSFNARTWCRSGAVKAEKKFGVINKREDITIDVVAEWYREARTGRQAISNDNARDEQERGQFSWSSPKGG